VLVLLCVAFVHATRDEEPQAMCIGGYTFIKDRDRLHQLIDNEGRGVPCSKEPE
jgi:hypothetical protein